MDPRQVFHQIYSVYILRAQQLCGFEIFLPNYRPHKVTFFSISFIGTFIVGAVYTLAVYERDEKFKCLCVLPSTSQILVTFFMLVRSYKPMAEKVALLQHIYQVNHRPGTAYHTILCEWSLIAFKVCRIGMLLVSVVYLYTLAFNVFVNTENPLVSIYLMGVDDQTFNGAIIHFAYHFFGICIWCLSIVCGDIPAAMFVVHMIPMMHIMGNMFEQMNERLRAGERLEGNAEFDRFFRNTIQVHKEICDYISGIAADYYFYSMFEVYSAGLTMCVGIYSVMEIHDYQLCSLMFFTFVKLLMFCLLGTVVENTTDDIYSTIIRSDWNSMPIKTQKMVGLMMARAQNPAILMAGTIPLNLDTFVNVMKTVYSVGMLLIESNE